ncbi:hypothetical protein V492_05421 [Pseudogymnoascus sp. VKM F-4246]|nr:hypothetical protein V492_05421 [Pseudogymnoascus sp. VKM F-4246]
MASNPYRDQYSDPALPFNKTLASGITGSPGKRAGILDPQRGYRPIKSPFLPPVPPVPPPPSMTLRCDSAVSAVVHEFRVLALEVDYSRSSSPSVWAQ